MRIFFEGEGDDVKCVIGRSITSLSHGMLQARGLGKHAHEVLSSAVSSATNWKSPR
jgi:hypothetical protein